MSEITSYKHTHWQSLKRIVLYTTECKVTRSGTDYGGRLNTTSSHRACQRWVDQAPHNHSFTNQAAFVIPLVPVIVNMNYCRNPLTGDGRPSRGYPWCYTVDGGVEWEYCSVPDCGK